MIVTGADVLRGEGHRLGMEEVFARETQPLRDLLAFLIDSKFGVSKSESIATVNKLDSRSILDILPHIPKATKIEDLGL